MTKIITIGSILLTFAVSMPALGIMIEDKKVKKSSSGLMTYANLNAIRNRKAKIESSESSAFKEGGREAFKKISEHLSSPENWAIHGIKPKIVPYFNVLHFINKFVPHIEKFSVCGNLLL